MLANPQLRTSDGLPAQAKFGEEVPVPQVTFAPIATGGVNQQPITSFTYRNVGVNIDITPRTHHNDDVTLAVKIEMSSQRARATRACRPSGRARSRRPSGCATARPTCSRASSATTSAPC